MAKKAKEKSDAKAEPAPVPRLQTMYEKEIVPQLAEKFGRKNRHSIPKLEKIVVSMGVGSAIADKKHIE
jgi:large subunit ribosomal protein L5